MKGAGYVAWGHSSVINPWGEVISKAGSYIRSTCPINMPFPLLSCHIYLFYSITTTLPYPYLILTLFLPYPYSPCPHCTSSLGTGEETIYAELEMDQVKTMRQNIPCWGQKRTDMYELVDKKGSVI